MSDTLRAWLKCSINRATGDGVRLAVGAAPRHVLTRVRSEGALIAAIGIAGRRRGRLRAGARGREICRGRATAGRAACVGRGGCTHWSAVVASLMPAARASRVDVLQALRSE